MFDSKFLFGVDNINNPFFFITLNISENAFFSVFLGICSITSHRVTTSNSSLLKGNFKTEPFRNFEVGQYFLAIRKAFSSRSIPTHFFLSCIGKTNDPVPHPISSILFEFTEYNSENIDELTRKIIQLIENKELRISLGNNAKNYSSKFSWSNQLEKFSKCVENINWPH